MPSWRSVEKRMFQIGCSWLTSRASIHTFIRKKPVDLPQRLGVQGLLPRMMPSLLPSYNRRNSAPSIVIVAPDAAPSHPQSKSMHSSRSPQRRNHASPRSSMKRPIGVLHFGEYKKNAMYLLADECESRISVQCRCRKITALLLVFSAAAALLIFGNMALAAILGKPVSNRFYFQDDLAEPMAMPTLGKPAPDHFSLQDRLDDSVEMHSWASPNIAVASAEQLQDGGLSGTNASLPTKENHSVSNDIHTPPASSDTDHDEATLPVDSLSATTRKLSREQVIRRRERRRKRRERKMRSMLNADLATGSSALPKPLAESLYPNATFSACLLIKDDNDILAEWLAYHYYTMNMRHVIVAVDPFSSESPRSILETWSNLTDLQVSEWADNDFMPQEFLQSGKAPPEYVAMENDLKSTANTTMDADSVMDISNHRYRQRVFLARCMKHLRSEGRTWVMHIVRIVETCLLSNIWFVD
jgi:hypothetical protein